MPTDERVDEITEVLARAWLACDPNRQPTRPDDIITDMPGSPLQGKPQWMWFVPRAEAMREFLLEHGFKVADIFDIQNG